MISTLLIEKGTETVAGVAGSQYHSLYLERITDRTVYISNRGYNMECELRYFK